MNPIEQAEAWVRTGRHADALALTDTLLLTNVGDARALIVRVNAANALGRRELAIEGLQALLRLYPRHVQFTRLLATALNNRGSALRERNELAPALTDFHHAIDLQPDHPQAWFNLALCLRGLGQREAASTALTRHLELVPDDAPAKLLLAELQDSAQAANPLDAQQAATFDAAWLAHTAVRAERIDAALDALARLKAAHDHAEALEAITELRLCGEADAARSGARHVIAAARQAGAPTLRAELIEALALPGVYRDEDDVRHWRQCYMNGLTQLEADWTPARLARETAPLNQLAHSNFYLAYQGLDDCELQSRFAALIERAAAALHSALCDPLPTRRSGRIGLLSSHWRTHTVGSYFGGWIAWLRSAGLRVYLYQLGPLRDATTDALAAQADVFRYFEGPLEDIARRVRDDDLDLLLYPEIGMDARMTPLAALRLARRQAAAWGHPVTTGFSGIDDFLTCGPMEPTDGASHYRERLIALPDLGVEYRRPAAPEPCAPTALGLDPSRPRVLVPQSLFKLHPEVDAVMAQIAVRVPRVQFVLFQAKFSPLTTRYRERLERAFARVDRRFDDHLVLQPLGGRERFLQLNQACHVMLDSLHWSGGNTAIDALSSGLPLVACPGTQMRGRQSLAMLQRLNLADELVVATPAAQAERVADLLHDAERRRDLSRRILERLPDLFGAEAAQRSLVDWARTAAE